MNNIARYRRVSLQDIDLSDDLYTVNPFTDSRQSQTKCSILHPPLLLETHKCHYIVIAGRQHLPATEQQREKQINALIVSQEWANEPAVIFSFLLEYKLIHCPPSVIEQAVYFKKTRALLDPKQITECLLLLGYKANHSIAEDLISLLQLDIAVQKCLHLGSLTLRAAKKMIQLHQEDQHYLALLIQELQLGGSKQQKLVEGLFELHQRSGKDCQEFINQWLLTHEEVQDNRPQKTASLLNWLEDCLHPRLRTAEEEFKKFCKTQKLPKGMYLQHTASFEDEQVNLCITFCSQKQLAKQLDAIKTIVQDTPHKGA